MALTRVITVTTEMACCRDGREAYHPLPKPIRAEVTADDFETSLTVWRDRAAGILNDRYRSMAEDECAGMGTLGLCFFNLTVTGVEEFGTPTTPSFVQQQIELLEERMNEADDIDEYMALRDELNRMKQRYGILTEEE